MIDKVEPRKAQKIFLVGPTGVGKTSLALALAKRLGAEIVGADAFQVYREIPVLTAQPTPAQQQTIPHHLVGVIPVSQVFDAHQFMVRAEKTLKEIAGRSRPAMIVGGSGMYLEALICGLSKIPPVPESLREELNALSRDLLLERLRKRDPHAEEEIDAQNPRRIQRALEIILLTGRPLAESRKRIFPAKMPLGFVLAREPEALRERIRANVKAMFAKGVVDEVAILPSLSTTARRVLGLNAIQDLIAGRMDEAACMEEITVRTWQYARRQRTWFRHKLPFPEISLTGKTTGEVIDEILLNLPKEYKD